VHVRNRDRDTTPFTTKDGSTIREYFRTERQSLAEASLAPGQATDRHYHARSEELYTILGGSGTMELDGDERAVGQGDTVLIPPGAWHRISGGPDGARFLCCCVPPYSDDDTCFE
jgi:quercetin dioxygenase-like cupin family protein